MFDYICNTFHNNISNIVKYKLNISKNIQGTVLEMINYFILKLVNSIQRLYYYLFLVIFFGINKI